MAYTTTFTRVTWLFAIGGTEEVAATSVDLTIPGATTYNAVLAQANQGASAEDYYGTYDSLFTGIGGELLWGDYSDLVGCKVAAIGTDGTYVADPVLYTAPTPTSGDDLNVPPQCTVVLSLRSGAVLGKGNYGRMYLPHSRFAMATGVPYTDSGITDDVAATAKDFLDAVNTISNTAVAGSAVSILSQAGAGSSKAVQEVWVGRITDTQRRRRNRLTENYSVAALA